MEVSYRVEHRNVKYPRLEFKGLELLVILPRNMKDPTEILEKRREWIEKKWKTIQEVIGNAGSPKDFMIFGERYEIKNSGIDSPRIDHVQKRIELDPRNPKHREKIIKELKDLLRQKVNEIIKEYAEKTGLKPNKVLIGRQKTKWGSCSSKKNIALNLKLVCLPEQTIRYVIFHELIHLKYRRHDQNFWQVIRQEFLDYKQKEKKLLEYWFYTEILIQNLEKAILVDQTLAKAKKEI